MIIAFGALAAVALLLFIHPYLTYPLSLLLFRRRPIARDFSVPLPSATLMFSARNEEQALPEKLANLRCIKALHPDLQLLAFCDGSSDGTLALLSSYPDLEVLASERPAGKAAAMAQMVGAARHQICIFTDANVILEPTSVAPLLSYFNDPAIGGVAGSLHYDNAGASVAAQVGSLYWQLEERIKRLESRCGSLMGADGSIFATRRADYPQVPADLLDDLTVSMSVVLGGRRLIIADDVHAREKSATSAKDEFQRKRRIACRAYNTHCHLWPIICRRFGPADIYKYVSHKMLRWVGVVPLSLFLILTVAALVSARQWSLVAAGIGLIAITWLFGRFSVQPFAAVTQVLESIVATFRGLIDARRGRTYRIWQPAVSRN